MCSLYTCLPFKRVGKQKGHYPLPLPFQTRSARLERMKMCKGFCFFLPLMGFVLLHLLSIWKLQWHRVIHIWFGLSALGWWGYNIKGEEKLWHSYSALSLPSLPSLRLHYTSSSFLASVSGPLAPMVYLSYMCDVDIFTWLAGVLGWSTRRCWAPSSEVKDVGYNL